MMERSLSERMAQFDENYPLILEEVARAARLSGRKPEDITLLAATNTVPLEVINHAISRGLSCLGENRVQELMDKYLGLDKDRCDVQFIGRLQTNKVKYLLGKVSCIQSVDSMKLAQEISRLCQREGTEMKILAEVNIGREESKGGVLPEELLPFLEKVSKLPGLRVDGLMAIPPVCAQKEELCRYFSEMRQYYVDIAAKRLDNVSMNCLSMGMSADFSEAIQCGATMVRVGSALFGARQYPAAKEENLDLGGR